MTGCQNAKSKLDLFVFNAEANDLDRTDVFAWLTSKGVPVVVATRLESLWEVTKKIADTTISLGKILISKLIEFIQTHPYTAIGVAMGAAVGALTSLIPGIGPLLAPLAAAITTAYGLAVGAFADAPNQHGSKSESILKIALDFFKLLADTLKAFAKELFG
ncbi:hypothetical protein [Desulfovibrio sp.]|uniref:hypothetical protein n=1 Tax=Desulfovibrio sp. TaxID=885 RepID=UPI003AB76E05